MNEYIKQIKTISLNEIEVNKILADWLQNRTDLSNLIKITYRHDFADAENNDDNEDKYYGCDIIIESNIKI